MIMLSNFVERLKELKDEHNLTQKQIADFTGLTETSISNYLKGKSEPSIKSFVAIADYFKCSTDYLFGLNNDSNEINFLPCPPLSERLQYLLDKKSCTGYHLCKTADIPEASFYDWKNGNTEPNLYNIDKLIGFFDCSLDYFLGREN